MRVVGVHGINQHSSADDLAKDWSAALHSGVLAAGRSAAFEFSLVYYADVLQEHRAVWKGDGDAPIDPAAEPEVVDLLLTWLAAEASEDDTLVKGPLSVPATPMVVQRVVQRLASSPGLQDLGVAGVRRLARQMHAYLTHPEAKEALWARVSAVIDASAAPTVLVGHSMGSVVAYEWLRSSARPVGLVTAGSPLGCTSVRSRLCDQPSFPEACWNWVNVAGRYDPIAWPKQLAPIFGDAVQDRLMEPRVWAHRIQTYLRSPAVGAAVVDAAAGRT